jgi:hypothetical protein
VRWQEGFVGAIVKVPLDGSVPTTLVSDQGIPSSIAVDGTSVYWTAGSSVTRVPIDGGTPAAMVVGQLRPAAIAIKGDRVFWLNSPLPAT